MKTILLYSTFPSKAVAKKIARELLSLRLIGCANILPAGESLYRWEGKIVQEKEVVMLLKTTTSNSSRLREKLVALHPYECPCVLELPTEANTAYADWLQQATTEE